MLNRVHQFLEHTPLLTFGAGVLLVLAVWFALALRPVSTMIGTPREIIVREGDGITAVGYDLYEKKILRSPSAFAWYGMLSGGAHKIKPGVYRFSGGESGVEMIERLIIGPDEVRVTIIEGSTMNDIDAQLVSVGVVRRGEFARLSPDTLKLRYPFLDQAKSLEGFLFPDTYQFMLQSDAMVVASKMLDEFKERAYPLLLSNERELYHNVIIASLIEKEIPERHDDRATVSGIIHRRLNINMGLQIDASIVYALCHGAVYDCIERVSLTRSDFQIDSPYNTYRYVGLPPSPIGNPGVSAIMAALRPKKTNYLYYLSNPKTGATIFSETFEEHDAARARYVR